MYGVVSHLIWYKAHKRHSILKRKRLQVDFCTSKLQNYLMYLPGCTFKNLPRASELLDEIFFKYSSEVLWHLWLYKPRVATSTIFQWYSNVHTWLNLIGISVATFCQMEYQNKILHKNQLGVIGSIAGNSQCSNSPRASTRCQLKSGPAPQASCPKNCSDQFIRIWMGARWNFHHIQIFMMTSSIRNIFRVTGPLCVEFTGHRWILLTKGSDRSFDVFFICTWIK